VSKGGRAVRLTGDEEVLARRLVPSPLLKRLLIPPGCGSTSLRRVVAVGWVALRAAGSRGRQPRRAWVLSVDLVVTRCGSHRH
jgi:hypothetical protein